MSASGSKGKSKPVDMTPEAFRNLQGPFADVVGQLLGGFQGGGSAAVTGGYQGPTNAAPIGANEQQTLNKLQQATNAGTGATPAPNAQTQQALNNTVQSGSSAGAASDFVDDLGIGGAPQQSLADFQAGLADASTTGAFGGSNPFLDSYVASAQRQTQQALEESLSRTLPGRFTMAGHQTQPKSSSAFDRAAAIATRGAADSLADISTNINYNAYEAAAGREASALENELGRRGQKDINTQNLTSDAQQKQLDRGLQAAGLQNEISQGQSAVKSAEIDNMIKNLQAQALPRMIQDLGIERGMEVFNQRVNSLLSTLGIAAGTTRPVISSESKQSSKGFGL